MATELAAHSVPLLDRTDRTRRLVQHGAILGGILLFVVTIGLVDSPGGRPLAIGAIVAGFALLAVASRIAQAWEVPYKGHQIRFVNNPILGEKLFIDDELAGKGQIGHQSEIRATLARGDGIGDVIIVRTAAGLLSFRCAIVALPAEPRDPARPTALSDEALLQEVRRRGLGGP